MPIKRVAVLFSGSGSNLEALLEKLHNKVFNGTKIEIALTITNKKDAGGIKRSQKFGIEPELIEHKDFDSREEFDEALVRKIKKENIDLTVLAGFMRILTPVFTNQIKAINLHPSLLPLFKGANAIKESFESNEPRAGVTVHWVSEELDSGEIIAQDSFKKDGNMSFEEFESKIHKIEHEILPETVIKLLCEKMN